MKEEESKIRIDVTPLAQWSDWDDWLASTEAPPLFAERRLLSLAGATTVFRALRGRDVECAFPVLTAPAAASPAHVCFPYFGPVFRQNGASPRRAQARRRDILGRLLDSIKQRGDAVSLPLHPSHLDIIPYVNAGFLPEVRTTWTYDLRELARWDQLASPGRRKDLSNAENADITVALDPTASRFCARRAAHWATDPAVEATILRQVGVITAMKRGVCLFANDRHGHRVGQLFVAWDEACAYALHSWQSPTHTRLPSSTLLYLAAMRYCRKIGLRKFDFEGSVLPGVERYYQSFGGTQTHFFRVCWARSPEITRAMLYDHLL